MKGTVHIVCKVQKMKKILQLKEQSCTGPEIFGIIMKGRDQF